MQLIFRYRASLMDSKTAFISFVIQGVVNGTFLVTPNAVMFDPNVSDTLVIEHGEEQYGLMAPMEAILKQK